MPRPLTRKPSGPIGTLMARVMRETGLETFSDFAMWARVEPSMPSKYWGSGAAPEDHTLSLWTQPIAKKRNPLGPYIDDFREARRELDELRRAARFPRRDLREAAVRFPSPDRLADPEALARFLKTATKDDRAKMRRALDARLEALRAVRAALE